MPSYDHPTSYFFNQALPQLICSYLVFGIAPVLSRLAHLTKPKEDADAEEERNAIGEDDEGGVNGKGDDSFEEDEEYYDEEEEERDNREENKKGGGPY